MDRTDKNGKTALMYGTSSVRKDIVGLLIRAEARVDIADKNGRISLMHAARDGGEVEIVKVLVDAGAKVDSVDDDGKTALMHAVEAGLEDIVEVLTKGMGLMDHLP